MQELDNFYRDVKFERLENGLKFIYKYFPGQIVGVSIFIGVGSADEGKFIGSGISHLIEHLVFEGRKDLEEELRKLGAISNAYTTLDHTLYYFEVPKQNLIPALKIFLPAIFNPSIPSQIFDREREVVLKEEKFRDDEPGSLVAKIGFEKSYINHPYKYPVLGESELIKKLTIDDVCEFHSTKYLPNNSVITIVGDLNFNQLKEELNSLISNFSPSPVIKEIYPQEKKNFYTEYSQTYPGCLVYVFISLPGISVLDPDLQALDLLADYISQGKESPLYQRFVKSGICYGISMLNYTPYSQGLLVFTAVLEENNLNNFRVEFEKFLTEIKSNKFNKERLERLKKRAVFEFLKSQESPLSIAQNLARDEGLVGNYRFTSEYLKKLLILSGIELKNAAQKYLNLDISTKIMLLPREIKAGEVQPKIKIEREYEKIEYPNGLRLILADSEISPLSAITVLFLAGVRVENENINGISQILPQVLITAELQRRFEELGGKIRAISGNNSLGLAVEVIESNFKEALKIISEVITQPKFDPQEFEVQKNIQLGKIKDQEIDLFYQAFKLMRESIYKKHPYKLMPEGSLDSVSKINLEDLNNFTSKYFIPNNCVISIVGKINPEEIKAMLNKYLSNWKMKTIQIEPERDDYPQSQSFADKRIPQREVVIEMGFMVPEITSQFRYHLDLISTLVSGPGSLFFNKIRREIGGAYTLGGSLFQGPDPGLITFYVATTPDKKQEVMEKMTLILKELSLGNITEEEIQDAKTILKTKFYKDTITNSNLCFRLALEEILGVGYREVNRYLDEIDKISKENLMKFLNKYIDITKAVIVEVGNL